MKTNRREIYRYLGFRGQEPDAASAALVESCVSELESSVSPHSLYREYPLSVKDGRIISPVLEAESASLAKNLQGCTRLILFAATLGSAPDRLIQKYSHLAMSRAVTLQAASAAMIEAYCNEVSLEIKQTYAKTGLYVRPRFSPGYGDFSLEFQPIILGALEAGKRIGIKLTDSYLMMPSKSVSAVMGAGEQKLECQPEGCEVCMKTNCAFRRNTGDTQSSK